MDSRREDWDAMESLQVFGYGASVSKQKAFEDAEQMQATVQEECARSGKPVPGYRLTELIGKGSFGRVYKANDIRTSNVVAVKIIDVDEQDTLNPKLQDTYSEFLKEVNALRLLSEGGAQNINHVIEALPVGQAMWMVTEYCAGGSVATLMKPTAPGGLQEKWIIPILREVAVAIYWVHKQGIIHRDIKCANVLITEVGAVQLCDFGVAGIVETKFDKRSTFIGTLHWMAPELFDQNAQYGTEVDIWAFGSMVYEIASGLPPNVRTNVGIPQFGDYLREHLPRLVGDQYSDDLKDLVAFCLEDNPAKRPSIEQIQQHRYIANTSSQYPTSSLSNLVKAFKLWEDRGGSRKSLFAGGGAQGPSNLDSTSLAADEWNFSTTLAFDEQIHNDPDGRSEIEAVRDVYGSAISFPNNNFNEDTARPKGKGRRRPPPQALAAMKAPLEKVFDPNTISNYDENSRAYYGRPMMPLASEPPTSDLPLRDDSLHATLRESLIDLDASLGGAELSNFVDMGTIRPGPGPGPGPQPRPGPRASMDNSWSFSGATEAPYDRAPLSDPADMNNGRHQPDWSWPTSIPPASANPEVSHFPFPDGRPRLLHTETEPIGLPSQGYEPQIPRVVNDRMSVTSLIDLDMGIPEPNAPELTRPSTAHSDVGSLTSSEVGGGGPFDLERHASVYAPLTSTTREPSIYVSEDSEFAQRVAKATADTPSIGTGTEIPDNDQNSNMSVVDEPIGYGNTQLRGFGSNGRYSDESRTYSNVQDDEPPPTASYTGPYNHNTSSIPPHNLHTPNTSINRPHPHPYPLHLPRVSSMGLSTGGGSNNGGNNNMAGGPPRGRISPAPGFQQQHQQQQQQQQQQYLPPVAPPSSYVMEARANNAEVADEMRRLIGSLSDHLSFIGEQVADMEPRRASASAASGVGVLPGMGMAPAPAAAAATPATTTTTTTMMTSGPPAAAVGAVRRTAEERND
ncbi:kinase-like domain-containing protein [Biscogniauxia marginata]|nr:kinase-like domain-containing protein [Biscogniauxia marginata]